MNDFTSRQPTRRFRPDAKAEVSLRAARFKREKRVQSIFGGSAFSPVAAGSFRSGIVARIRGEGC